jgi:hypothetical protein
LMWPAPLRNKISATKRSRRRLPRGRRQSKSGSTSSLRFLESSIT